MQSSISWWELSNRAAAEDHEREAGRKSQLRPGRRRRRGTGLRRDRRRYTMPLGRTMSRRWRTYFAMHWTMPSRPRYEMLACCRLQSNAHCQYQSKCCFPRLFYAELRRILLCWPIIPMIDRVQSTASNDVDDVIETRVSKKWKSWSDGCQWNATLTGIWFMTKITISLNKADVYIGSSVHRTTKTILLWSAFKRKFKRTPE